MTELPKEYKANYQGVFVVLLRQNSMGTWSKQKVYGMKSYFSQAGMKLWVIMLQGVILLPLLNIDPWNNKFWFHKETRDPLR